MAKISVIHAQDAAQSLWSLCQMNHQGPINLCSPDALSLSDLMGLIETATQTKWRPGRMGDERSRYDAENDAFMNSAMAKSLGIVPRTWKLWLRELIEQEVRALS
jgi:dTDP-4-dehydrorhamnose reductase